MPTPTTKFLNISLVAIIAIAVIGAVSRTTIPSGSHSNTNSLAAAKASESSDVPDLTFRDIMTDIVIAFQFSTTTGLADFNLMIPDRGFYHGTIPWRRSGLQIVHPQGTGRADFQPLDEGDRATTTVRMEGEINIAHNSASLNFWLGKDKYRISANMGSGQSAKQTAEAILQLSVRRDWEGFYDVLATTIRGSLTGDEFADLMDASPIIIGATTSGPGEVQTLNGYSYYSVPVSLAVREPAGSVQMYASVDFFVLEKGEWKYLSSTTPEPVP